MDTTQRDPDSRSLSEDMMAGEPMTQFALWMSDAHALGLPEPTAMVLATTSADGRPRARTVLLKTHDQTGFTFLLQGPGHPGQSPGVCGLPLVRHAASGDRRGQREHDVTCGKRTLFQVQAADVANRSVGQQAVAGHRLARGTQPSRRGVGAALGAAGERPDAGFLGRLPAHTGNGRILAGGRIPPARPLALPASRRRLGHRAPVPLMAGGYGGVAPPRVWGARGVREWLPPRGGPGGTGGGLPPCAGVPGGRPPGRHRPQAPSPRHSITSRRDE